MSYTPEGRWYSSSETRWIAEWAERSWQAAEVNRQADENRWRREIHRWRRLLRRRYPDG